MKILVSTKDTQGQRPGDFCWVPEGEIVTMGFICDNGCCCGCAWSLCGIASHKATTTFKVENRPLTREEYERTLLDSFVDAGWTFRKPPTDEHRTYIQQVANDLLNAARRYPAGAVLEVKGNIFRARKVSAKAHA